MMITFGEISMPIPCADFQGDSGRFSCSTGKSRLEMKFSVSQTASGRCEK
jgi:hypothetical protein